MAKDFNGNWTPWFLGTMVTLTFSFTSWTAVRVIALEKQTFSYQFGARAESIALEEKFDAHCNAQAIQDIKVDTKLDRTYDKVMKIAAKLEIPNH